MNDDKFKLLIEFIFENAFRKGYKKGLKRGISISSHQAYNKFVKHGHWVEGYPTETTDYFSCSVCNAGIFVDNSWRVSNKDVSEIYRYCRGCGAKMEEERTQDET